MTLAKTILQGAAAPEFLYFTHDAPSDGWVTDLTTVTAASLRVVLPGGGGETTWAATVVSQTTTQLVVKHTFDAPGTELALAGSHRVFLRLTTAAGTWDVQFDSLQVNARTAGSPATYGVPELGDSLPANFLLAPTNSVLPSYTGSLEVGSTCVITPGVWSGSPTPTLTYSLLRDGAVVVGQTGLSLAAAQAYAITTADVGHAVAWRETATNAAGTASAATASQTWTPNNLSPAWFYDAGVGVSTSGNVVTAVADQSANAVNLSVSGTSSQRPTLRAPSYELGGARAALFCYETNTQYANQAAATSSALLHKASTWWAMRFAVGSSNGVTVLDNTFDARLTSPGVTLTYDGTQTVQAATLSVYRGGGNYLINNYAISNVTRSQVHTLLVRMNALDFDLWLDDVQVASAVAYTGSPSASDPGYPLRWGTNANLPNEGPSSGWLGGLLAGTGTLSDARASTLRAWLANKWPRPVWAASSGPVSASAFTGTKRILFVGDSHTYGTNDTANDGFLLPVKTALAAYGDVTWQFIGPIAGTNAGINHDGRPGWTIRGHLPFAALNGHGPAATPVGSFEIEDVMAAYDPHVIVLMIGFNNWVARIAQDQFANDDGADLLALLRYMRAQRPAARYVICDEIWNTQLPYIPDVQAWNLTRAPAVAAFEADGATVVRATVSDLIGTNGAYYSDTQHLNATGNALIAPRITQAIRWAAGLAA